MPWTSRTWAPLAVVALVGCGGERGATEHARHGAPVEPRRDEAGAAVAGGARTELEQRLADLQSGNPAIRRIAVRWLGLHGGAAPAVIRALVAQQMDADPEVGRRAVEALDAINPPPEWAVRAELSPAEVETTTWQEQVGEERVSWERVECPPRVEAGEVQGACYVLRSLPAAYVTHTAVRVLVPARRGWRLAGPGSAPAEPPSVSVPDPPSDPAPDRRTPSPPIEDPAGPLPENARQGEVWCSVGVPQTSPSGGSAPRRFEWRLHSSCAAPVVAPPVPDGRKPAAGRGVACGAGGAACGVGR